MFHRKTNTKSKPQDLKPDFIAKLLTLFSHSTERGSALPMAVGLGVVMLGATGVALMNSSRSKTDVASDEMKKEVVAVAEGAVARFQNLFVQEPGLAVLDQKADSQQWTTVATAANDAAIQTLLTPVVGGGGGGNLCPGSASETGEPISKGGTLIDRTNAQTLLKDKGIVNVSSSKDGTSGWMSFGGDKEYRLKSYDYDPGTNSGTLKLQSKSTTNGAKSQLLVVMPVKAIAGKKDVPATSTNAPALWITDTGNDFGNNEVSGTVKIYSPTCKSLTQMTEDGKSLLVAKNFADGKLDGNYVISKEPMPETPSLPASKVNTITTPTNRIYPITTGSTPDVKGDDDYYHYLIDNIKASGKGENITISADQKVKFYLKGDLDLGGGSSIIVNDGATLELYGNTGGKYGKLGTQTDTLNVKLSGSPTSAGVLFIHAPNANGGVNGGGNFKGSVWVKSWNLANGNHEVVTGAGAYGDYTPTISRKVHGDPNITFPSGISKWSTEEATD